MSDSEIEEEKVVEVFVKALKSESSIEVPREEWDSLISLPIPLKSLQFSLGLLDVGSGEICAKYITQSSSTVDRHPYFKYPCIKDPGINEALLHPTPQVIYPDDGQELYISLCQEMNQCPVRCFYVQLLEETIDLSYYGVDPRNVRAIAKALDRNRHVKSINFKDNFMSVDGCFHLGEMLSVNTTLTELILSGCRIGPVGAKQLFANLNQNSALLKLNLSRNELGDEGVEHFADAIFKGTRVVDVDFSHNLVVGPALVSLAEAFETHNKLTHINLSWNRIGSPNAVYALCAKLAENEVFREMRLAWNGLKAQRVANAIKILMKCKSIQLIDVSNNALTSALIAKALGANLGKCPRLHTLDLSYNPFTETDAKILLDFMKNKKVKLKNLLLDGVCVDYLFFQDREEILSLPFRKNAVISHGYVREEFKPTAVDMKNLMMSRAQAICQAVKKKEKPDFAVIILTLKAQFGANMGIKEFSKEFKDRGVCLDEDLLDIMSRAFAGPKAEKTVYISLDALAEYVKRKWPDAKLPPPDPVIEVIEEPKKKKKK